MKIIYLDNELKPGMAKKELCRKLKIFPDYLYFVGTTLKLPVELMKTLNFHNSFYLSLLELQSQFERIWL